MKKFVAIIMAILIMASLCACNTSKDYSGTYEIDQDASYVASMFCHNTEDFISCSSVLTLSELDNGVGDIVCRARVTAWDEQVKVNTDIDEAYDNAMDAFEEAQDILNGDFNYEEYMKSLEKYNDILSESVEYERVEKTADTVLFYGTYTINDNGDIAVTMNEDSVILWEIDDEYQNFVIDVNDGVMSFSFKDYGDIYEFVYK